MDGRPYEGLRLVDSRYGYQEPNKVRMDGRPYEGLRLSGPSEKRNTYTVRMDGRPYEGLRRVGSQVPVGLGEGSEWTADPMRD